MDEKKIKQIEKIFGAKFEEPKSDSLQETIKKIESYGAQYDPNCFGGSAEDQLLVCEAIAEATPIKSKEKHENDYSVKCLNGTSKQKEKFGLNQKKLSQFLLAEIEGFTYKTPPLEIAAVLEKYFSGSKPGHWLWAAQNYTPKTLRSRLRYMEKRQREGWETIENPGGYLTDLLKHKKKRKRRF